MSKTVYIFDVDGVLNRLDAHTPDPRVIQQMSQLLAQGSVVTINTGRSYRWVQVEVIEPIRAAVDQSALERLFVSAEMGGVSVSFSGGDEQIENSAFSITTDQINVVHEMYNKHIIDKDNNIWDPKKSMATIYKSPSVGPDYFAEQATPIADKLRKLFDGQHVKIVQTVEALDVMTPESGKWAGAQLIHDWLVRTGAEATEHFICFGDNVSDYQMAEYFAHQNHRVTFVFTGTHYDDIQQDKAIALIRPSQLYADGTHEYLTSI